MADTVTIDALRQELWSAELFEDVMRDVEDVMQFVGEGPNNIVQVKRDLATKKGDTQTFGLLARLSGNGVTGDSELEGNEEGVNSYSEQVLIDQVRNAVRTTGELDAQKVTYDQIEEGRNLLRIWFKEFICRQIFLKLGGVTNLTIVDTNGDTVSARAAWSNTPDYIPDAHEAAGIGTRYLCVESTGTDGLATTDIMDLDTVSKAATLAKLANPKIQPIERGGDKFYVMFLHPLQARDIKLSDDWKNAQMNAQIRGDKNPVFKGAMGFWDGVMLVENEYVPWLDTSVAGNSFRATNAGTDCAVDAARALICGRQAAIYAEAKNPRSLTVKTFDYGNKTGVAASLIGGIQKAMFNSKEFGVIAVDSAAAL